MSSKRLAVVLQGVKSVDEVPGLEAAGRDVEWRCAPTFDALSDERIARGVGTGRLFALDSVERRGRRCAVVSRTGFESCDVDQCAGHI